MTTQEKLNRALAISDIMVRELNSIRMDIASVLDRLGPYDELISDLLDEYDDTKEELEDELEDEQP